MKFKLNSFIALMLLLLISNLIAACSTVGTTKPNSPFSGPYPESFNQISERNPLLVKEIGKLPEIQDGILESDIQAIENICYSYLEDPEGFDSAFIQMYQTGIPEIRKYCSPLQALYWLAQDGRKSVLKDVIHNYALGKLLEISWRSKILLEDSFNISAEDALFVAKNCINEVDIGPMKQSRKRSYLFQVDMIDKERNDDFRIKMLDNLVEKIHLDYKINPGRFTEDGRKIIEEALIHQGSDNRWSEFNVVVDRLNDPVLLNWYINNNISYKWDHLDCQSPKTTFKIKKGCCVCVARFGAYALDRAGYKTAIRHLRRNWFDQHGVLVLKKNESYFIVVDFKGFNTMSGPFKSMSEVDKRILDGNVDFVEKSSFRKF